MKKLVTPVLALGAMMVAGAGLSSAATVACTTPSTNLSFSTATIDPTGYTCGDKLFSNINISAAGTLVISEITADLYKFNFTPTNGFTTAAFTWNFTVASTSSDVITSFQDQMFTAAVTGNSIPNASTASVGHTGGSPNPDLLNAQAAQNQTGFVTFGNGVQSTNVTFSYNPTGSAGFTAGELLSMEFAITESSVPEPMTLSLMGLGLLGLGVFGRKRMVKH